MGSILGFMFWEGWAWAGEAAVVVDPSKAAHLANHLSVEFIVQLCNVQCAMCNVQCTLYKIFSSLVKQFGFKQAPQAGGCVVVY